MSDPIHCPILGCNFSTGDQPYDVAVLLFKCHTFEHEQSIKEKAKPEKGENISRPKLKLEMTAEEWSHFETKWLGYKTLTKIPESEITIQLLQCCDEDLSLALHRTHGNMYDKAEDNALKTIKTMAVKVERELISRVHFWSLRQDRGESIKSFLTRIKGRSLSCNFEVKVPNSNDTISYASQAIKDVLVLGLEDQAIQADLLGSSGKEMSLEEVITFIEAKESGKESTNYLNGIQGAGAVSSTYKRENKKAFKKNAVCCFCGNTGHGYRPHISERKKDCPAYGQTCTHCNINNHFAKVCRKKRSSLQNTSAITYDNGAQNYFTTPTEEVNSVLNTRN